LANRRWGEKAPKQTPRAFLSKPHTGAEASRKKRKQLPGGTPCLPLKSEKTSDGLAPNRGGAGAKNRGHCQKTRDKQKPFGTPRTRERRSNRKIKGMKIETDNLALKKKKAGKSTERKGSRRHRRTEKQK